MSYSTDHSGRWLRAEEQGEYASRLSPGALIEIHRQEHQCWNPHRSVKARRNPFVKLLRHDDRCLLSGLMRCQISMRECRASRKITEKRTLSRSMHILETFDPTVCTDNLRKSRTGTANESQPSFSLQAAILRTMKTGVREAGKNCCSFQQPQTLSPKMYAIIPELIPVGIVGMARLASCKHLL